MEIVLNLIPLVSIIYLAFIGGQIWESSRAMRARQQLDRAQKHLDKLTKLGYN